MSSVDVRQSTAKAVAADTTIPKSPTTKHTPQTTASDRTDYFSSYLTPPDLSNVTLPPLFPPQLQLHPRTAKVVWRDFLFIVLGAIGLSVIGFVETNASDIEARSLAVRFAGMVVTGSSSSYSAIAVNPNGIVDTGYIVTQPMYEWLRDNRDWNDTLAFLNSLALLLPTIWVTYATVWKGDYSCVFRVLAVQLMRAYCGWYTYLPPDPTYLNSNYDFPDFIFCIFKECSNDAANATPEDAIPFVSFFSGHVATMVIAANHVWLSGHVRMGLILHVLNVLQIVRLLATRGHYSIDLIIAWYMAVQVTNPAGRLGRYYSRGLTWQELIPKTAEEAFASMTGVEHLRQERRISALTQTPEVQEALQVIYEKEKKSKVRIGEDETETETTVKILQQTATANMKRMMDDPQVAKAMEEQMSYLRVQREAIEQQMGNLREQAYAVLDRSQQTTPTTATKPKGQ